ncbi:MAG: polyprenyl diphosphate synthase [Hydrotalea sp.]|nr:polyprenyl diphosphate synthase [Hydrotalea sp.]
MADYPTPTPPRHVAIIMDGNGRWAERRGLPRELGHAEGAKAMERVVKAALVKKIPFVSFYCFSTENWSRPKKEVELLMNLLRQYLKRNFKDLASDGVRIRVIGQRRDLPTDIVRAITKLETDSMNHENLTLVLAINYGARADIVQAVEHVLQEQEQGLLTQAIDEDTISNHLWTRDIPDPDVIVRSSGEHRLSNFFLWQAAYAEFIFTDRLWPDIAAEDFDLWLKEYEKRQRRFGGRADEIQQQSS